MTHPLERKLWDKLYELWASIFTAIPQEAIDKYNERGESYDNELPVWVRMPEARDYATLVRMKANRIMSEINADGAEMNENNVIDLIVWAMMLLTFLRFVKRGS
jgi:hypothetical protein